MKNKDRAMQKTEMTKASHITQGNILDDLGFASAEAENLKMRAMVLQAILKIIKYRKYTQRDIQKILDQPQSRVSELLNGKISKMSLEKLLGYHRSLGGIAKIVLDMKKAA